MDFSCPALESELACDCTDQQNEEGVMLWDSKPPKGLQGTDSFHFLPSGTFPLGMLPPLAAQTTCQERLQPPGGQGHTKGGRGVLVDSQRRLPARKVSRLGCSSPFKSSVTAAPRGIIRSRTVQLSPVTHRILRGKKRWLLKPLSSGVVS